MADKENGKSEEKGKASEAQWQSMRNLVGERTDVELPEDVEPEGDGHKTLSQRMAESPNLSDTQTLDRRLFPDLGRDHLNALLVGEIFPDVYNPMQRLIAKDLLAEDSEMSVTEAMTYATVAVGIPLDRRSRIELMALAGIAHEEEMAKEQNKVL